MKKKGNKKMHTQPNPYILVMLKHLLLFVMNVAKAKKRAQMHLDFQMPA